MDRDEKRERRRERFRLAQERAGLDGGRLPDFLIIGAQKGGTTTLFRMLAGHPLVERPAMKEVHFFDAAYERGAGWYRSHFPAPAEGGATLTGECTPYYLYDPRVPARAARVAPDALLIALLRNPVDRAYSHYQHEVRLGTETLPFEEAIEAEGGRLRGGGGFARRHFSYLGRGHYAEQLARWRDHFDPERMLVLRSGDLFAEPAGVLGRALGFLGLPAWEPPEAGPQNAGSYGRGMDPATRRTLEAHFRPHNRGLYDLLGEDWGW